MTQRTKIMTIVAVVAFVNMMLSVFDSSVLNEFPRAQIVYKILSAVFAAAAWACSHYFNQDFTEEACIGSGVTANLKAQKKPDDIVYTEPDEYTEPTDPGEAVDEDPENEDEEGVDNE